MISRDFNDERIKLIKKDYKKSPVKRVSRSDRHRIIIEDNTKEYAYKWMFRYKGYKIILEYSEDIERYFGKTFNCYKISIYEDDELIHQRKGFNIYEVKDNLIGKVDKILNEFNELALKV